MPGSIKAKALSYGGHVLQLKPLGLTHPGGDGIRLQGHGVPCPYGCEVMCVAVSRLKP